MGAEAVSAAVVVVADRAPTKEARVKRISIPSTRLQDMLIYHHLKPVSGTGPMASQLIFVWSLAPAHGSNTGYQDLILNEIQTSSDTVKTVSIFKNFYIQQNFHK